MLDEDIVRIAEKRVLLEIGEQTKSLNQEIGHLKESMAARGALRSGATSRLITQACAAAIKTRAQIIWQTLFRFITTGGISYSEMLAEELKTLVSKHLPKNLFKNLLKENVGSVGLPNVLAHLEPELDAARIAALTKVGTEIDLFVHALKKKEEMREKETTSTTFNIYSPVGAIQTGDSSIANITQNIDTEVREQLTKILEEISSRLTDENVILPYPKKEIIEIIQEGQGELKKQSPNITKLRGMLSAVGTAIQTIASLKPAYDALKQALTFLGISLP